MQPVETTTKRVLNSLMWSLAQNWGNRILTFVLFLVLARLLTPADLGVASTIALILLLLSVVAEFGYGQAIVQKSTLDPADPLLPFAMSMFLSLALSGGMAFFAPQIEAYMQVPGLSALLPIAALTLPLTTLSAFQEAFYRRHFDYKMLALRMLCATLVAGTVGIGAALAGWGPASLVLQALTLNIVSVAWLWAQPRWLPGRRANFQSWRTMTLFSMHVVASRLLEFATTRLVDIVILATHGVAALGLYTIGSRVYQTLMQVLTSAVTDVSLSALSRIADDRPRLRSTYLKTIGLSAFVCSPLFVAFAVLSPEISSILFGARWAGSADIMRPLMILGAVQTVQFVNGAYFSALGKPDYVLGLNVIKIMLLMPAMVLIPSRSIADMMIIFVICQLAVTPLTFFLVVRLLGVSTISILVECRGLLMAVASAVLALAVRPYLDTGAGAVANMFALGSVFGLSYLAFAACFARSQIRMILALALGRSAKRVNSLA